MLLGDPERITPASKCACPRPSAEALSNQERYNIKFSFVGQGYITRKQFVGPLIMSMRSAIARRPGSSARQSESQQQQRRTTGLHGVAKKPHRLAALPVDPRSSNFAIKDMNTAARMVPTPPVQPQSTASRGFKRPARAAGPSSSDLRPLSRSDASASFFFRTDPLLCMDSGQHLQALKPARLGASALVLPPLEDDGMDAELLDTSTPQNLLDHLTDDILHLILDACPASTLRECIAVDKRTHDLAKRLLRSPKFQLRRSLFGGGRQALREAARRVIDAKFARPPSPPATRPEKSVHAALSLDHGAGVRLELTPPPPPPPPPPRASLSEDRTVFRKLAGGVRGGWSTMLMDKWVNSFQKEMMTIGILFESLSGAACIGVVGINFLASDGGGSGGQASPLCSRHAIVLDAVSGGLYVKGARTPMALPRERVLRPGEERTPILGSGSRLNIILNMATREMTVELLPSNSSSPWAVSTLEVENLPHEVALAVGLGPSRTESSVQIVGCKCQPADVRADYGKTVKDLWDESNVIKPLHHRGRNLERGSVTATLADALTQEAMAMAEEESGFY